MATENAVCALGKVLEFHGNLIQGSAAAQSWNLWVSSLPLVEDRVEAKYAHAQLVRHIEASDARYIPATDPVLLRMLWHCRAPMSMCI